MLNTMDNQSYQSYGGLDRPLFGESSNREKYINYGLGAMMIVAVLATVIAAVIHFSVINLLLAVVILLNCLSNILLIYWYRQGDLDPKFLRLIYYNTAVTFLLCLTAFIVYFAKK